MKFFSTKWYSIISGTVLLIAVLLIFIFIPCPTNPQQNAFRIVIAIAAGAFAASIPGKINIKNDFVTAGGSIAVVVFVYLVNPAGWKEESDCSSKNFRAIVYVDNQLTKDVEVVFPALGKSAFTDTYGAINVEYLAQQLQAPVKLIFKYKSAIDTTITINALTNNKVEFYLKTQTIIKSNSNLSSNALSVNFGDLNVNVSLINPNKTNPDFPYSDTVSYTFSGKGDTIFVKPASKTLSLLSSHSVITASNDFWCINYPQFDFKLANNSDEAIFMNEIQLAVSKSLPDNSALIVPSGLGAITFLNVGWGTATNVRIDFDILAKKDYRQWLEGPYKNHYQYQALKRVINWRELDQPSQEKRSINIDLPALLKPYGIPPEAFELGGNADLSNPNDPETRKFKKLVGRFDAGGMAYGTVSYQDSDGKEKQLKFQTPFEISSGYGAAMPEGEAYTLKFKPSGEAYALSSPISRGIKPKDFDRFSIVYGATQSSKHIFKLSFLYNARKITLPYVFVLDYFNTPDGV
ncbi:hypothetical protein [Pedobacter sp. Leaf194]|uniref:hypothetical protein n=1 Tax=Pedobacter sp. Leaf194 TaxID=1736297 RepID=UPI00070344E9|nr:hypothetical protein [Pedobacter sp. Leaf194]KQS36101.1 hypothetical protein ASG14_11750 [Pedobacter sp. Leaf194]